MRNLYISGYRSFELGIFKDDDPKIAVIKKCLKQEISQFIEEGIEWILTSAQFGTEQWAVEVVDELKKDYPMIKVAVILPFLEFGSNWNEKNQTKFSAIKKLANYVESTSHKPYQDPSQLRNHQEFLLDHCQAALLVYDPEFEGKTKFVYQAIKKRQETSEFELRLIDVDQLQNSSVEEEYY
ncbi:MULTISPECIES: DUF1273 domain-containing protein [Carnobacterium]|uniref:UPF0398 protein Q783_04740 n=2 Tax=Carnobacterium inhibens TaxID=147709 RepID=U5S8N9_9LACT|nr:MULTISPECIES: DUF1273 domain-containing protein [Carnobacterium]AGY81599.1 hypothetical protein Q783_04740 [Carnobacterium inhibens subsp. gilichinskyi]MBC9824751.1 DUF1273 family protein [Carnobacterium inhibens]MDN5371473.1 hypothetical protein [Carnobacterium sp.]